jgi:hypothetical protein
MHLLLGRLCIETIFFITVHPCGNFSDTSGFKPRTENSKGSIGHAFAVRIRTENRNQTSFYPSVLHEISVPVELVLGHLRYLLTDVPPQPNSPPDYVFNLDPCGRGAGAVVPPVIPPPASASGHARLPTRRRQTGRPAQRTARGPEAALPRLRTHVGARMWGPRGPRLHPIK